ncbi:YbaB/EbfC family nucleoid-associated protein [Nocardia sp. NBC_00508]|uniref:YbaB/EbfC family nucleoid-associated protein n=1 Tax=Nocardia sp. NBC_00508 TaxID=2975992 RepID=UPI002E81A3E2|nr:YbaB/EbfC family nucleoid-associated protein [Nocardia sp. NBC_00508]WUD68805.1 YbaB/EbfC family nucleoid-associated protein [Nocardia sp. NBC_00508]
MDDISAQALEIKRLNEQLAAVRGSARSVDGSVSIETDVNGRITDLYLADYAMENGPDRLAALIIDRHRAAVDNANTEATRIFDAPVDIPVSPAAPAANEPALRWTPSHLRRDDTYQSNQWHEPTDWDRRR